MCLHNFSGAFFFKFFYLISQQFLSKKKFFLLICNPLLVMCIWYKCSILLMIFIFWSIHGYYIRKEKNLCFSGVCQPNQKLFIDYLPVWGNSNLIFSQCPWCISSYGCWLLWALWARVWTLGTRWTTLTQNGWVLWFTWYCVYTNFKNTIC